MGKSYSYYEFRPTADLLCNPFSKNVINMYWKSLSEAICNVQVVKIYFKCIVSKFYISRALLYIFLTNQPSFYSKAALIFVQLHSHIDCRITNYI